MTANSAPRWMHTARELGKFALICLILIFVIKFWWRFFTGRDLLRPANRRATNATFTQWGTKRFPGHEADRLTKWAFMPEYQRALIRIGVVGLTVIGIWAHVAYPTTLQFALYAVGGIGGIKSAKSIAHWWKTRTFRRVYLKPLAKAAAPILNVPPHFPIRKWIEITPELEGLLPDLIKPMSKREEKVRAWYGAHIEPALRYIPDYSTRCYWWLAGHYPAVTRAWQWSQPREPHISLRAPEGYVNLDAQKLLNPLIGSKLGISSMVCNWRQVGSDAIVTYTVKERPPTIAGLSDILAAIDQCAEYEYIVGLGPKNRPIKISLENDSPHIACSAGSGAGKSVLAQLIAIQVLRKRNSFGERGNVVILDQKGSHRWARDLPGVIYCTEPSEMHNELIRIEAVAKDRNRQAIKEDEGWDCGARIFVIFEEMNATVALLKSYWDEIREQGQPKASPAIQAFRNIMYMGRSAKVNLFGVAQMLTANTTGGPESRENFGIRCLARYTANNWKMLVPQCAMPRRSRTRGRWQIVVGDDVYETQVAFASAAEARDFVMWEGELAPGEIPTQRSTNEIPELVELREAIELGLMPGYTLTQLRSRRAQDRYFPKSPELRGTAKLYRTSDLQEWAERCGSSKVEV
jgi:hypothetical protein